MNGTSAEPGIVAQSSASFRERILAGEPLVGTFLNLGSSVSAEICTLAGFDWALVDLEHGSGSAADMLGQLQALSRTNTAGLVRVELSARTHASRALDAGAAGIVFPRLESAAEVRAAIGYLRFPPDGVRGVASQNRTGQFGRIPATELALVDDDVIGVVQVETTSIVTELDEVASVPGVDVLFVGPGDLSYALGVPGQFAASAYVEALRHVVTVARRHGCSAGVLVPGLAEARRHLELGFRFVAISSDSALIMSGATALVDGFRSQTLSSLQ